MLNPPRADIEKFSRVLFTAQSIVLVRITKFLSVRLAIVKNCAKTAVDRKTESIFLDFMMTNELGTSRFVVFPS